LKEKTECFVHFHVASKFTAYAVVLHRFDHRLFLENGVVFIVQLEFDQKELSLFDSMYSGDGKAYTRAGNIVDMDDAAANSSLGEDFIGTGKTGLFTVMAAKIKQQGEDLLATAANGERMPAVTKLVDRKMFNHAARRANNRCRVVVADMHFEFSHGRQS
jgi:hypothetical protein